MKLNALSVWVDGRTNKNAAADLLMKKNLRLVWCQIDVDGGGQHRHFEHGGGMAVPRHVVQILSRVVLPQQLASGNRNISVTYQRRSVFRHLAATPSSPTVPW